MEATKLAPVLTRALILLALSVPAFPQGSNSCSSAQPITGAGLFSFDNTTATTDGVIAGCIANPSKDVWFLWTAPSSDLATVRTCGYASLDTMLVAYNPGTCPPTSALVCGDDTCATQTQISFVATAGTDYLLRVGVYPDTSGGTGSIEIVMGHAGCGDTSVGPDVIVGDLFDIMKWGTLAGVTSYSLGTYSCNIGDEPLQWISGTNRHPVIGQNVYRMENGRFEQVGMSWLKHGFTALTDSLCCTCINPGTGSLLGVGCADPYTASLNGSQSRLGPRFEVNPWTGVFAYPFTSQGQTGDVLHKRIQIANSDIDPALRTRREVLWRRPVRHAGRCGVREPDEQRLVAFADRGDLLQRRLELESPELHTPHRTGDPGLAGGGPERARPAGAAAGRWRPVRRGRRPPATATAPGTTSTPSTT